MSLLKYWNGSAWTLVPDGTMVKYWNGSAWVMPSNVWYWNGSAWVNAWKKSNPATYTFYPTFTTNIRWDGSSVDYDSNLTATDNGKATLGLGRYNGSLPYHYTSLLKFDGDATNAATTLAEALATRPVCTSASLRLYRNPSVGLTSPAGYLRTGIWSQLNAHLMPATKVDGTYHDWSQTTATDIAGWLTSSSKTFTLDPEQIEALPSGKSLMFSEVTSGYTTSGGTSNAHSQIYGLNDGSYETAKVPLLTVTLDLA